MKPFRITTIHLDEDHDVSGITAVIDAPYLPALMELATGGDNVQVTRRERGDTELWVELNVGELMSLFREVGNRLDADPLQIPGAYNALTMVVYGLMED
uniref:hypothetical protein n=1 Tax=Paractinoplanes polyasparticus TaxID=2856853 RepID=UPI001C84EB6E|nr:hypothetical protein [Actinoplanes polyasparticus]